MTLINIGLIILIISVILVLSFLVKKYFLFKKVERLIKVLCEF